MGHWEQIGESNIRHRARQARKSKLRRGIEQGVIWVLIVTIGGAYWAMVGIMIWKMIKDLPLI
jgi:hypothetical protein